jgi:YHS domain-containing protein
MAIDPIWSMAVDERTTQHAVEYAGQGECFCSPGCKRAFNEEPQNHADMSAGSDSGGGRRG